MMVADEWGRDPGVQRMRGIFGKMERAQREFLGDSTLSPFDERLKKWRRKTLKRFERHWARAVREGIALSDDEVAALYVMCLADVIRSEGVEIPSSIQLGDEKIIRLMEKDFQ